MNDPLATSPLRAGWRRHRPAVFTALLALLTFMGLTAHGGWWRLLGVEHMRPFYADTVTTLAASETWAEGGDPFEDNYRDPYGRPHTYGPWWLWAASLGLERRDAWWLGSLLVLAFVGVAAAVARPRTPGQAALLLLCLVSPPSLLGLERANSDLVIFVLLAGAAWLLSRPRARGADAAATAVLVAAAALKFYPLISLGALLAKRGALVRRFAWVLGGAAAFGLAWWLQRAEFQLALREAARPATIFAYGLPMAPLLWEHLAALRGWLLLGAIPVLVGGGMLLRAGLRELRDLLPLHGGRSAAALAGGAAWLLCFVATTNFPYRAVLLFLLLPFWLDAARGRTGRRLVWLLLGALWLMAPKYWLAPPEILAIPAWRRVVAVITGADQAAWFILTLALTCSLAGWAWRRWRADDSGA